MSYDKCTRCPVNADEVIQLYNFWITGNKSYCQIIWATKSTTFIQLLHIAKQTIICSNRQHIAYTQKNMHAQTQVRARTRTHTHTRTWWMAQVPSSLNGWGSRLHQEHDDKLSSSQSEHKEGQAYKRRLISYILTHIVVTLNLVHHTLL